MVRLICGGLTTFRNPGPRGLFRENFELDLLEALDSSSWPTKRIFRFYTAPVPGPQSKNQDWNGNITTPVWIHRGSGAENSRITPLERPTTIHLPAVDNVASRMQWKETALFTESVCYVLPAATIRSCHLDNKMRWQVHCNPSSAELRRTEARPDPITERT